MLNHIGIPYTTYEYATGCISYLSYRYFNILNETTKCNYALRSTSTICHTVNVGVRIGYISRWKCIGVKLSENVAHVVTTLATSTRMIHVARYHDKYENPNS